MTTIVKKELGLTIFLVLLSISQFVLFTFFPPTLQQPLLLVLFLGIFLLWLCVLAINLALLSRLYSWLSLLVIVGVFTLFARAQITALVGAFIFLLLALYARQVLLRELGSRIEFHTRSVFYHGLKYLLMGAIILLLGIAMPTLTQNIMSDDEVVPESLVRLLLKPYEPYLQNLFPGSTSTSQLEDIVASQIANEPAAGNLPREQQQFYSQQIASQLLASLPANIASTNDIATVITEVINNRIRLYSNANPLITPVIIFALVIIISRFVVAWLAIPPLLMTTLLIYIGRKAKLFKLLTLSKPVDKLEL